MAIRVRRNQELEDVAHRANSRLAPGALLPLPTQQAVMTL